MDYFIDSLRVDEIISEMGKNYIPFFQFWECWHLLA
jgi:hypothetical protein